MRKSRLALFAAKTAMIISSTLFLTNCNNMTIDQRVDALYDKMSQEERIAQLKSMYMDQLFDDKGQLDTAVCRKMIPNGIGHFSQYASQKPTDANTLRDRVKAVQRWLIDNTPNGIPALFHEEVLSGINTKDATIYPQQIGQACSFNDVLAEKKTRQTATSLRKMGGVLSLSPMVDVVKNPGFNRLEESYGEDAYLSAVMGTAFVRGLQQGDLKKGVGACAKHYLGYGGGGNADEKELMEEILLPHETMIRLEGCRALMPGYHAMRDTNCVANSWILTEILRGFLGFDGMVVSDYTAIDQIPGLTTPTEKAAAAINAGNDVDFPHGDNYKYLQEGLDSGLVRQEAFERAVKDVLRYKMRAGLFDNDAYLYSDEKIVLDGKEERQTAYEIATQSVVMLENDGILPLKGRKKVFVTGPNANSMWAMCGDYSFPAMSYFWKGITDDLDHPHIVRLLEAMRQRMPQGMTVEYSRGCDWTEEIETKYAENGDQRAWEYKLLHRKVDSGEKADREEALRMAKEADVIVAAMGENVMLCGENRDRKGLRLPGSQERYVEELISTGKPVVLVMFGGRAQVISAIADRCAAILQAWYPGEEGGNAVADILYGKVSPSAKLSVSYPNVELYEPICYSASTMKDNRVAWPFGYGLSYTKFEYGNLRMANEVAIADEAFTLTFDVKNTGNMDADEIAQIYLSPANLGQNLRPMALQGFARVSLKAGEKKTVKVTMHTEQMGFFSHDGERQWNIVPGRFVVKVAASSQDIRLSHTIVLKGEKVVKPIREHYFSTSEVTGE